MSDRFTSLGQPDSAVDIDNGGDSSGSGSVARGPPPASRGVQFCGTRLSERRFMVILTGLLIVLIVLAFALFIGERLKTPAASSARGTCQSPTCIQLSAAFMTSMNATADPCQDFYEYACGGWSVANPIPDDKSRWSTFNLLSDNNLRVIRNVLEDKSTPSNKATVLYQSCMNESAIEAAGNTPIVAALADLNWSPTDDNNWSATDLSKLTASIAALHLNEVFPFFSMLVYADDKNSVINVGHMSQSGLGLPDRAYYLGKDRTTDTTLLAYQKYLTTLFSLGGLTSSNERLQQVLDLETLLARWNVAKEDLRDPDATYNKMNVSELPALSSAIQWSEYYQALFTKKNASTIAQLPVIVSTPQYITNLTAIITQTNKQVVVAYLQAHFLLSAAPHLSSSFVDATFAYNKVVYGLQTQSPRWKTCISRVDSSLGFMLGKMFTDKKFPATSKKAASDIYANINKAFKAGLPSLSWMDDATRVAAGGKADAVTQKIGYPDWIEDPVKLEKHYEKLTIVGGGQYWTNIQNIRAYEIQDNLADMDIPVDKTRWDMTPPTVNAYYNPSNNEIAFPAGILQPPFFDKNYPQSVNYGAIGVVVGHELTHGFDDQGSRYDATGNLRPWWSADVTKKFQEKTKCIVDQYSQYTVNGEHVKGELTLGENIADNGGVKEAFAAYQEWARVNGQQQLLPGLSYGGSLLSHEQLFFLSFAQPWCGAARDAEAHRLLLVDPHSPARYRVIGSVSNSPEFAAAFKCPVGSAMNPKDKCLVW